jgi:outer membrane protein TolC
MSLHGSFSVTGAVNIPIYQGGRVRADVEAADAVLRQRKAEVEDLRGQIDAEVRTALTDLNSASRQVEVATKNVDLAKQELQQARDRFAAGVTNNLEVVQAQDAVALANENYISSLYYLNTAKASLLRSRGDAEQTIRTLLRSRK